jgi:hypothetical protein
MGWAISKTSRGQRSFRRRRRIRPIIHWPTSMSLSTRGRNSSTSRFAHETIKCRAYTDIGGLNAAATIVGTATKFDQAGNSLGDRAVHCGANRHRIDLQFLGDLPYRRASAAAAGRQSATCFDRLVSTLRNFPRRRPLENVRMVTQVAASPIAQKSSGNGMSKLMPSN